METSNEGDTNVSQDEGKQPKSSPQPGPLSWRLKEMMDAGAITVGDLMGSLKMGKVYVRSLMNGHRRWAGIQPDKLRALARRIGYPPITVLMLAGIVRKSDFFGGFVQRMAAESYEEMADDSHLCVCLPSREEWDAASREMQSAYLLLYNSALRARTELSRIVKKSEPAQ